MGFRHDFKAFVENQNTFCNTLVDRIVTGYPRDEKIDVGYTDNMLNTSELFHLWVIKGDGEFLKELPFDKTGLNIIVTDNVERYRTRKLRILNGAPVPTVKIATNNNLAQKKNNWIDFDASPLLYGETIENLTQKFANYIYKVTSGEYTKNEINDYREISIFKDGVVL